MAGKAKKVLGMTEDDAWALAEGRHPDPFGVLGWQGDEIRAHLPGAVRAWVLQGRAKPQEMTPHASAPGVFALRPRSDKPYRLRGEAADGTQWDLQDPYRFAPVLGEIDEYLLGEGSHARLWHALGAHLITHERVKGVHFAVWAPNAQRVSVVGDFNLWNGSAHPMRARGATGVWEIFIPDLGEGTVYKYELRSHDGTILPLKADPLGFGAEHPPATGSVVRAPGQKKWADRAWMKTRAKANSVDAPISIYEVHLGSWRRAEGGRMLSYTELADQLVSYAEWMGFTHLELMPVSEFPFDGSWGYQPVGMYAPTVRHGTPAEFAALVEAAHKRGLGVILDWVPGHFPTDAHGLGRFDGSALYEHADPKEGFHTDWNTLIYNYGRAEVKNYLTANALYWLDEYHLDGLRVDAVASMLYRDYSREDGQWVPNHDGGRENYEAIAFLQDTNRLAYGQDSGVMTVAEESTSFPAVSGPVDQGGLGFGFKWNMGWMNDTLAYIQRDPIYRSHHHNQLTFGLVYAFSENFVLPISHDEVVHGKGSMLGKMPGNDWEKFANLRAYYGFMWGHPGKKLLFMGQEFAQGPEWNHAESLDWGLELEPAHRGIQLFVRDLNLLYRDTPALYRHDTRPEGFEWIVPDDAQNSVLAFIRRGDAGDAPVVVVVNFTPVERSSYRIGLPAAGQWDEVLNSDAESYGGGNRGNLGGVVAENIPSHGQSCSAELVLPPLSVVILRQG